MRVLRLTPFFHHPDAQAWSVDYDAVGGMQVQAWRQSMWLAQHGVSQHVMTIGFPGLPRQRDLHANLRVERAFLPLPEVRSELTGLWGLTQSWALATLLAVRRLARRNPFDLLHVHLDGQIPALFVATLAPVLLRLPTALTVHCSRLSVYRPMSTWDRVMHGLACRLERQALAAAGAAIVLTERTAAAARPYARRVEIVPDVVDAQQFCRPADAAVQAFRRQYGLSGVIVGFIGRIAQEKGWPHFVVLADRLRHLGLHFLVVGDGPQRKRLEETVQRQGLQSLFTITGFIPNDQIPAALAACGVVVMPSEHEEFGGVAIEALAVGTPVAAYAVGGITETLGRVAPEWLATPGDLDELVTRVRSALASGAELGPHVERGRTCTSDLIRALAPDAVMPRVVEIYRALVGPTGPGWAQLHARAHTAAHLAGKD